MANEQSPEVLLQRQHIPGLPPSMFYIPNFITEDEEQRILDKIPANRWISLTHRRLQAIPAQLTSNNTLVASTKLPHWLTSPVVDRISGLEIFEDAPHGINHCLINEYLPGQGIMPHEDGAAYHPVVATVSLGGSLVLDVTEKRKETDSDASSDLSSLKRWRIFQEPRSLLLTSSAAYTDTLHGISEVMEDLNLGPETVANWSLLGERETVEANGGRNVRTDRISLTYRDVKKVSSVASKLFGKSR